VTLEIDVFFDISLFIVEVATNSSNSSSKHKSQLYRNRKSDVARANYSYLKI